MAKCSVYFNDSICCLFKHLIWRLFVFTGQRHLVKYLSLLSHEKGECNWTLQHHKSNMSDFDFGCCLHPVSYVTNSFLFNQVVSVLLWPISTTCMCLACDHGLFNKQVKQFMFSLIFLFWLNKGPETKSNDKVNVWKKSLGLVVLAVLCSSSMNTWTQFISHIWIYNPRIYMTVKYGKSHEFPDQTVGLSSLCDTNRSDTTQRMQVWRVSMSFVVLIPRSTARWYRLRLWKIIPTTWTLNSELPLLCMDVFPAHSKQITQTRTDWNAD